MMSSHVLSPWIAVDSGEIAKVTRLSSDRDSFEVSPSPYDVPMAVRVDEGDPKDVDFIVEMRYLGGSERTKRERLTNLSVELGHESGRVYRVIIRQNDRPRDAAKLSAIGLKLADLASSEFASRARSNWYEVGTAIRTHAKELAAQLHEADNTAAGLRGTYSRF